MPSAIAAAAGAVAIVALRLAILFRYRIDSDETQHLHVAWGWTHGLLPYRDVFDNHMPLFHMLSAPLLLLTGERPEALIAGRLAMLPVFALIVMLTYRLAASCWDARAAAWATAAGTLVPVFFLCSVEFRPDVLWAACWLASLFLLRTAGVPPAAPAASRRRHLAAGIFLGIAIAISAKSFLLAISLIAALILTRERPKNIATLVVAALIPPSLIAAWFAAMGAWNAFITGTITHNLVAHEHPHRIAFLIPSIAIITWIARRLAREDIDPEIRRRRVFLFLASSIYGALLISFWPIIEREHWLPFYPAFAAAIVPPFLGRRPRVVAAILAFQLLRIIAIAKPWTDQIAPAMNVIAQGLRLTAPNERVVDLKGDLVFRRRASYDVFEKITKKAIAIGRMPDTIEADVLHTHAMVAIRDDPSFPRRGRAFLQRNFIDVGAVRVAGKIVPPSGAFVIEVPGEYALVPGGGSLDGTRYVGPRHLARGLHTLVPVSRSHTNVVIWSRAVAYTTENTSTLRSNIVPTPNPPHRISAKFHG